jgi:hypothetical protein
MSYSNKEVNASRKIIAANACGVLLLACASLSGADGLKTPPRDPAVVHNVPLGVFVHIDVEYEIQLFQAESTTAAPLPEAVLRSDLKQLEASMLANPAISGILVGENWDHIQTSPPDASDSNAGYDWGYLDDAFAAAAAAHKSVQLNITPGFNSPPWLIGSSTTGPAASGIVPKIASCDPIFASGGVPLPDCGTVTFVGFPESQRSDGNILPLPWNSVYQQAWDDFLAHLNARYQNTPEFASIAVAGPVGGSNEMILPTSLNSPMDQPLSDKGADYIWSQLILNSFPNAPTYWNSDQAFIDSWEQAIDAYETIFSGVTLFIGADDGKDMPQLGLPSSDDTNPVFLAGDCKSEHVYLLSCETKTEVLSYFVTATSPSLPFGSPFLPPNGKATQVGGMTASTTTDLGDIGVVGVKLLTCEDPLECNAISPLPSPPFRGGAQFDYPVTTKLQEEGCPISPAVCNKESGYPNLTPELGAYYVMKVFFDKTAAGPNYGGTIGSAPIHYLSVTVEDVQYAEKNPCATPSNPALPGNPSMQDLLNRASHDLLTTADPALVQPVPPSTCILGLQN